MINLQHLALLASVPAALALRTITVDNQCKGTVWPAVSGPGLTKLDGKVQPAGWKQAAGAKYKFRVPDSWPKSRIWARTGCNADGSGCKTGSCSGGLVCSGSEFGGPGATLAEFTMGSSDFYDVSMVDGFNLPMTVSSTLCPTKTGSCGVGAGNDILTMCDSRLVYPVGSSKIWACVSPCNNGLQLSPSFDWNNSAWCCRKGGAAITPQINCSKDDQPFYKKYKAHCQKAYVYPADDNYTDPDAVFECSGGDYTVTLCPGGVGEGTNPKSKAVKLDPGVSLSGALRKKRLEMVE